MIKSIDTKLDAVNHIIGSIGESPVNSIEDPANVDVINAISTLDRVSRKIQSEGWIFNTLASYKLNPDVYLKKIAWNSSIIRLRSLEKGTVYIKRGSYLYNLTKQTDTFTEAITAEVVLLMSFEDLPEQARNYITAKAALDFQIRFQGDDTLTQSLEIDRRETWEALQRYVLELESPNMLERADMHGLLGDRS